MQYTEPHYSELSVTYINDIKFGIVKLFIHKLCQNIIRSKMLPEALGAQSLEVSVKYPVLRKPRLSQLMYEFCICIM